MRAKEMLQVLRRVKTARGSRFPRVVLHQPLHRYNFQGVRALVQLALSAGCDGICLSPFVNWGGALPSYSLLPEQEDSLRRDLLQLKGELRPLPLTQNIDEVLLRYKIGEAVWQKQPCYIGWVQARIKMDGTVVPCGACALSLGDLRQNSFLEIWHGPAFRVFRRNSNTREGLQALNPACDCRFRCFTDQDCRAHLIFKWFSAFAARS
jgi:MoaA/NifB/PqqE/SkfB family radical SAM enzyme